MEDHSRLAIRPKKTRSVSLTGAFCNLNCKHCQGAYLKNMDPLDRWINGMGDPDVGSLLISGGMEDRRAVPFGRYRSELIALRESGMRINLHVGFPEPKEAALIGTLADVVSLDLPGTDRILREVYGIPLQTQEVMDLYQELVLFGVPVHPHITVGLENGRVGHEQKAIQAIQPFQPKFLTINVLIPTKGTAYESADPPDLRDVRQVFSDAIVGLPQTKLILGCMQPKGRYREDLQMMAYDMGFYGWVQPVGMLMKQLAKEEHGVHFFFDCCAFAQTLISE
jgi:hypothetical protein